MKDQDYVPTQGILTFAVGLEYQKMAYCQALTAKKNLGLPMTVVIKEGEQVYEKLLDVATVLLTDLKPEAFQYESLALILTDYDITYKTDADVLFPRGSFLYHNPALPCTSGVACNVLGAVNDTVAYRPVESNLGLPTIYSACFSFDKRMPKATEFYKQVKELFEKWYSLKLWDNTERMLPPTTDSIYSLAWAKVFGMSRVDGNQFIHAKPILNDWVNPEWTRECAFMVDDQCRLFIDGVRLTKPFHYYDKSLITEEFIERLEDVCLVPEAEPAAPTRRKQRSTRR